MANIQIFYDWAVLFLVLLCICFIFANQLLKMKTISYTIMKRLLAWLIALSFTTLASAQRENVTPTSSSWLQANGNGNTLLPFEYNGNGKEYVIDWGLDVAWNWDVNVNRGTNHIGKEHLKVGRVSFQTTDLVDSEGNLSNAQRSELNRRLNNIAKSGVKDIIFNSDQEAYYPHAEYVANYYGKPYEWYRLIKASVKYAKGRGYNTVTVSPFNEPDYTGWKQGSKANFKEVARLISEDEEMAGIRISAGNTLNCDQASSWYNAVKPYVTEGNTHQLAGSFDNYVKFWQEVARDGNHVTADELHNTMEAFVAAHYGMQTGIWWGFDGVCRGQYCRATSGGGAELGYAENRNNWTAGCVYRLPNGRVKAFMGASERQARPTTYEMVSLDRDAYFDGYGPYRSYPMLIPADANGTYQSANQKNAERLVEIYSGEDVPPCPVDTGTYVLMNMNSKMMMSIQGGSTNNATAVVQNSSKNVQPYQQWVIEKVSNTIGGDFSYVYIKSARNQSMLLDVLNWSLNNGGSTIVYTGDGGTNEQWHLEYAGNGSYYIQSRYSGLYLQTASASTNVAVTQAAFTGKEQQKWRFMPIDAARELDAPAAPTGLEAKAQSASVILNWEANTDSDLDGYMVLRGEETADGTVDWNMIGRLIQGTKFIDNSLEQNKTYYYKVKAIDRSRNQSEASEIITAQTSGEKALIAEYEFDDSNIDNTENYFDAAMNGTSTYANSIKSRLKSGTKYLSLDGTNNFLSLPYQVGNQKEMTICTWFYTISSQGNWQRIFDFGNGTEQYMFFTPNSGSDARLVLKNGGDEQILKATRMNSTAVKHLAITLGADSVCIYLDGEQIASSTDITIRPSDFKPVLCYIGKSQFANDPLLRGILDDFRIYNYALSAEEIAAVMEDSTNEGPVDGVQQIATDNNTDLTTEIITPSGIATQTLQKGVNVVKSTSRNGKRSVKKVMK